MAARARLDAELVRRKLARSREQAKTWDYDGWVAARADEKAVSKRVGADLGRTERAPVSATFRLSGGSPQVVPARDGARIDWRKTTQTIVDAALAEHPKPFYAKGNSAGLVFALRRLLPRQFILDMTARKHGLRRVKI